MQICYHKNEETANCAGNSGPFILLMKQYNINTWRAGKSL